MKKPKPKRAAPTAKPPTKTAPESARTTKNIKRAERAVARLSRECALRAWEDGAPSEICVGLGGFPSNRAFYSFCQRARVAGALNDQLRTPEKIDLYRAKQIKAAALEKYRKGLPIEQIAASLKVRAEIVRAALYRAAQEGEPGLPFKIESAKHG